MENRYLLQMFALSESLIYYLNAIEANGAVLAKLRANAERLAFPKQDVEFLHGSCGQPQCARQAQIYSTILSGLMDARGTIVNNNVNVLLKNLTFINIIFLPLTLIASIGGMSEFSMMTRELTGGFRTRCWSGMACSAGRPGLRWYGYSTNDRPDRRGQKIDPQREQSSAHIGTEHCVGY